MTLKELLIEWLTESRYCRHLEAEIVQQRQDFTERLADKDSQIKSLRVELAAQRVESDRMRMVLMPLSSQAGRAYAEHFHAEQRPPLVPDFSGPKDWQGELRDMIETEEKNGIQIEGRQAVLQSSAHDGA